MLDEISNCVFKIVRFYEFNSHIINSQMIFLNCKVLARFVLQLTFVKTIIILSSHVTVAFETK